MKLSEEHIQQTVVSFLELDGWRPIRTDPVSDRKRGTGFGEKGMPDFLFIRYNRDVIIQNPAQILPYTDVELFWVEFKAPKQKPKPHQLMWHYTEKLRGALVLVVDDIDGFQEWYEKSGLARKIRMQLGNRMNSPETGRPAAP